MASVIEFARPHEHYLPSKTSELANSSSSAGECHSCQRLSQLMSGTKHDAANAKKRCSKESDAPLAEQILEIADEWAH